MGTKVKVLTDMKEVHATMEEFGVDRDALERAILEHRKYCFTIEEEIMGLAIGKDTDTNEVTFGLVRFGMDSSFNGTWENILIQIKNEIDANKVAISKLAETFRETLKETSTKKLFMALEMLEGELEEPIKKGAMN